MLNRLLIAGSLVAANALAAGAQMSTPPGRPSISAATHCRDANGMVRLMTTAGLTAGSNTVPSSSPTTSSSVNSPSGMPGSTEAEANLPPC
jgi:hypothetical protein